MATQKKISTNKKTKSDKPVIALTKKKPVKTKTEKKPKQNKKSKKILNKVLSVLMFLGIIIMVAIIVFCTYIVINAPDFDTDLLYEKEATILYDRTGETEIARLGAEQRILVSYDDLPEVLIDAIVATEDSRFFQHNGFDVVRFAKASFGQLAGQEGAGGASTLTMQVVKNTFTSTEASGVKGIIRKFTDIYMSIFMVEKNYTKEEIIEFYVNAPFLGNSTYGVEQASQTYFGKSVKDLTLAEASLVAGMFNAPSVYNPFYSTELSSERRNTVLNLMVRHGYITEEQAQDAKNISVESIAVEPKATSLNKYQTYIDVVAAEVEEKTGYDPYNTPMIIYTTMDIDTQEVLIKLNNEELGYKWVDDQIQIGLAITDVHDGSIRGIDGARNQNGEKLFNRATDMKTQPGSTAKPIFAYGPYLEYNNGNTGTLFFDNKMKYSNGQPLTNSDNSYKGAMTMRQALAQSRNIPAVQAFQAVEKDKIAEFVHACGIDFGDELYESYAIGGGLQVSPLDMAAAYGTFARGGYYIEPYSFTKIIFQETDEVYEQKYTKVKAMSEETAYMINDMLVTATKQGVGGNIRVSGTDIASKTGTSTYDKSALKKHNVPSSASADNWVITYSPDYVISFWYGYDELSHDYYTDSLKAAIQRKKISAVLANNIYKKNSRFSKPSGVVSAKYEQETNPAQLPSDYTPAELISTELFKKGTEPSEVSTRFSQLENPTKGETTENEGQINISWEGISTPSSIDNSYLQDYFDENYGQFASTYLEKRNSYNANAIGSLGYQVYLSTPTGLQSLGWTADPYFVYQTTTNGTYTFVVKSAYSIFKSNMSSGLTITTEITSNTTVEPTVTPDEDTENKKNETTTDENKKNEKPTENKTN